MNKRVARDVFISRCCKVAGCEIFFYSNLAVEKKLPDKCTEKVTTLIPPNSRILGLGIFRNVSLEPKISSTKSGFQIRYPLNNKNSELENSGSLEPRIREGLV